MKRVTLVVAIALYSSMAWARSHHHRKAHHSAHKRHYAGRLAARRRSVKPRHVIFFDLDDTPSASQIEPLSLAGQERKSAAEISTGHTNSEQRARRKLHRTPERFTFTAHEVHAAHVDPNFGTANDGREQAISNRQPASVGAQPIKLSAHEFLRIQQSMRRKTSDALADYN